MKNFISIDDLSDFEKSVSEAIDLKNNSLKFNSLGKNKSLAMLFFNPSLRTRLSTQKAAQNLGFNTMVMNFNDEGWKLEFQNGVEMNGSSSEHVKEAASVISQYCDIIAIRAFASLNDKEADESELVINSFCKYSSVPIINMESATAHPLQALADAITIKEHKKTNRPKVVLTWAPHPKPLPHAVANSFVKMIKKINADFVISRPEGYHLNSKIEGQVNTTTDQEEALKNADFVYAKNWCSYKNYGKILKNDSSWKITSKKMNLTNNAKFMHCLPVRRNIIVSDSVIESPNSLVIQQARNRVYATQLILKKLIENE
ncbi:MAG: acetylornithine carbamoyltransferase [Flavobacteriaceae bacterium]|nr:acetylornithine carbamoyltransferase [Flavobacteriaceae bacterium]|tara:strand:+ start:102 stop:1049 length:948 start_codon:yes stop_codon:yes gene_type:complete